MNDTTAAAAAEFLLRLRQRSGSDRVRMVSDMFDVARALAVARIRDVLPTITEGELRAQLFEQFYGRDFSAAERARIIDRLRRS